MKRCRASRAGGLAVLLVLTLLTGGCAGSEQTSVLEPDAAQSTSADTVDPAAEAERLAVLHDAAARLERYRWPRETVKKDILGQELEFFLYHGNGWTIHVPVAWEETWPAEWQSPSQRAGFEVSKMFLGVNNPKSFRAQAGSWRHETGYDPPFDYYYDNDGGYTPPDGSADYRYFFAPDGDDRSFEFTLHSVAGEITEEELAIQEAMLLSFTLDDSSRVLRSEPYTPGRTEWDAALAGLLAETEPIWFHWDGNTGVWEDIIDGKGDPDYLDCALPLEEYRTEEFIQTFFGNRPEEAPEPGGNLITLCLPQMKLYLYFYDGSPWVHISHAGEDYWAVFQHEDGPDKVIFDAVYAWLEAERTWAAG